MIDFRKLIEAGVHFGHQTSRWSPKMEPYIWGKRGKTHLIDVSKTAWCLERAAQFLKSVAADEKIVLWVGTKKPAQQIIHDVAISLKMPYVNHRWIGGTLSNHAQVKKSVTKLLHYEDILSKSDKSYYKKKELVTFQKRVDQLRKNVGGIQDLKLPIGAVVLVDSDREYSALLEANAVGIPVVALVDTNSDPSLVDHVIPTNDDAPQAIDVLMDYLANAVRQGQEVAKQHANERAKEKSDKKKQEKKDDASPEDQDMRKLKLSDEDDSVEKMVAPKKDAVAEEKSSVAVKKKTKVTSAEKSAPADDKKEVIGKKKVALKKASPENSKK